MITIKIGSYERIFSAVGNIDENWIKQQIRGLRNDGYSVCVRITIDKNPLNMVLTTQGCNSNGGSTRLPNYDEKRIFEFWHARKLDKKDFDENNLVAFLMQVRNVIE